MDPALETQNVWIHQNDPPENEPITCPSGYFMATFEDDDVCFFFHVDMDSLPGRVQKTPLWPRIKSLLVSCFMPQGSSHLVDPTWDVNTNLVFNGKSYWSWSFFFPGISTREIRKSFCGDLNHPISSVTHVLYLIGTWFWNASVDGRNPAPPGMYKTV